MPGLIISRNITTLLQLHLIWPTHSRLPQEKQLVMFGPLFGKLIAVVVKPQEQHALNWLCPNGEKPWAIKHMRQRDFANEEGCLKAVWQSSETQAAAKRAVMARSQRSFVKSRQV